MSTMNPFDRPSAWRGLENVYRDHLVEVGEIRVIVEIGVDYGFSMFHFAMHYPRAVVIGIDPYEQETWQHHDALNWVKQHLPAFPNTVVLTRRSEEASREVYVVADVIHIDAIHTYEDVRADFVAWERKLRPGGCVMFHDIDSFPSVGKFFEELPGAKAAIHQSQGLGFWFKPLT